MSFWATSDGEIIDGKEKEFDGGGGQFEVIPNDTKALAMIDEAKWDKTQDGMHEYIALRWVVMKPDDYKNRKVPQKLWVTDADPNVKDKEKQKTKKDKAKRMLAAIDANCGGKLVKIDGKPSTAQLTAALCNNPMVISIMVWEQKNQTTGESMSGNWVRQVAPKDSVEVPDKAPDRPAKPTSPRGNIGGGGSRDMDDDIPF